MTVELKVDENFVSYVLDTYDLSDRTRERLEKTVLFRLRDNGITDFDEAYSYIDSLAMGTELRHHAKIRSLDEEVGETERTLHEIIGTEDENLRRLFEDLQSRKKLSGQEVVECLSYCLDRQDTEILSKLMERQRVEFDVSLDYLLDNAEEIGARIRQTAQKYERDGIILFPKKLIVSVSFDPFEIKFENRIGINLTEEEQDVVIKAYKLFGGSASAAAKHLGYSGRTIIKYWRKVGLHIQEGRRDLQDEDISNIISAHSRFRGNATKAAESLGYAANTILKQWKKAGLETINWTGALREEEVSRIIFSHSEFDRNATRAARNLGYGINTILRYWKKAGLDTLPPNMGRPKNGHSEKEREMERKVVSVYDTYNGNASRAAMDLGHSLTTVIKYWRSNGLEIRSQGYHGNDSYISKSEK